MKIDFILLSLSLFFFISCNEQEPFKRDFDFNNNWEFSLSNSHVSKVNTEQNVLWESINLPHVWRDSVVSDITNDSLNTAAERLAYYKKDFTLDLANNEKAFIWFRGDASESEFWVNGHKLGERSSGYSSFYFDLSDYIKTDGSINQMLVKIAYPSSEENSSCMRLNAKLVKVNKLYIPISGIYCKMQKKVGQEANVSLYITLNNAYTNHQTANVVSEVYDASGKLISSTTHSDFIIKPGQTRLKQNIELYNSLLKDRDTKQPYSAETKIYTNNTLVDVYKTDLFVGEE